MDLATKKTVRGVFVFSLFTVLGVFIIASIIKILLLTNNIFWVNVEGQSMAPTLSDGGMAFIQEQDTIQNEKIVIFQTPAGWAEAQNGNLIKRVKASPGDTLSLKESVLYRNDEAIYSLKEDNYYCENENDFEYILQESEYFVMGDNHKQSVDSLRIYCASGLDKMLVPDNKILTVGELKFTTEFQIIKPFQKLWR